MTAVITVFISVSSCFRVVYSWPAIRWRLPFDVGSVEVVCLLVFHDARNFGDEIFVVAGAPKQMKTHLHARRNPARRDDPSAIDHSGAADLARRRNLRETVDGNLAELRRLGAVGFFAVGGGQPVQ